jgi:hypothetical protein
MGPMAHDGGVTSPTLPPDPQPDSQPAFKPDQQPGPKPTGRKNARMGQTVGDMVRSLALVLALVGVLVLITYKSQQTEVRTVDVSATQTQAQRLATFPLLTLAVVDGLNATSVRWEPTAASGVDPVWHVGYVSEDEEYFQVSQSATTAEGFISEQTAGGLPAGQTATADGAWQRYETDKRRSLVRIDGPVTTIVSGTGSWDAITKAADSLSVQ